MTATNPKTDAQKILDEVANCGGRVMTEMDIARLKAKARSSIQQDPFHAYMALGAIAALAWDDDELDAMHRASMKIRNDAIANHNYAISLKKVQRRQDAMLAAKAASQLAPEDITLLIEAIESAAIAGHITEAMQLSELLSTRSPEHAIDIAHITSISEILAKTGVPERELEHGQSIVFDVLRRHRIRSNSIRIAPNLDGNESFVIITMLVDTDYETAQHLDDEASARLCEELPGGGHPEVLMFGIAGSNGHGQLSD